METSCGRTRNRSKMLFAKKALQIFSRSAATRFRLVRWYIAASLVTIGLISVLSAEALSRYLVGEMLERDMVVATEFMNTVVKVENTTSYFYGDGIDPTRPEMEEFFRHVAALPDVIRANVYGQDRSILWSSDPDLIGHKFDDNEELENAFRNKSSPEFEVLDRGEKQEHANFPEDTTQFVENYLPIWSADGRFIVGAVELYKSPRTLLASISRAKQFIWIGVSAAGLLVFFALALVVRNASRILAEQEARTIEAERLAVVGEMTSAVAHGIRNPLAAIRSCAELALEDNLEPDTQEIITDIVRQSDRLESWIRSFLTRSHAGGQTRDLCRAEDVLRKCLMSFAPQMAQRSIEWNLNVDGGNSLVQAPPEDLTQILNCLISNGIEAIDRDGAIHTTIAQNGTETVAIDVVDTGPGFANDMAARLFEPFVTGKSSGLGVGLSLARRTIERLGGRLDLSNSVSGGAKARIILNAVGESGS